MKERRKITSLNNFLYHQVAPSMQDIVRMYQEIVLPNPWPRSTGTQPQARVYPLQYITQGTGADGYFYSYVPYSDGWDWEWTNEVNFF